jgi:hypothetical protein
MPGQGTRSVRLKGLMGTYLVPEPDGDVRVNRRDTPVHYNPARVDRVNEPAMSYVTRQPETIHIEGLGKGGAERHVQQ